jgi:hypothetical protein
MKHRRATIEDCEPGAVLMIRGEFWDVVGVTTANMGTAVRLINDYGVERNITLSLLRSYTFVRPAPRFDRPVLDDRVDQMRRRGIFNNLDAA